VNARVVIPTWNGGGELRELLAALRAQRPAELLAEIVVIDSESSDGTPQIAREAGARVIPIARAEFNHGATRTRAADGAETEAIVFLVQDALPEGSGFLASLLEPLGEPGVAGAYARVVPRAGARGAARRDVERDLVAGRARLRKRIASLDEYQLWPAGERRILCHFNNVASAIRAEVFRALPFRALPFGEDLDWGKRALEAGHTIAFAPDAVVAHSHENGWARDFRRQRDDAAIERQLFGTARPRSLAGALARAARLSAEDLAASPRVFAPALRLAQALGRWRGARGSDQG
jgi:rhamnosyltransferase